MTFIRRPSGRYWRYELDRKKVPSVTTLINAGVPKPALVGWAARIAAEYTAEHIDEIARLDKPAIVELVKGAADRERNAAAATGTDVHKLAERLAGGEHVDVPEGLAGLVDGYLAFVNDWQPEIVAVEAGICNRRWWYAGTFDILARFNDVCALVDIKTGASGVWPDACLQIAAYRHAEVMLDPEGREVPMPATQAGYALWLTGDGGYQLLPMESGPDIFAVFLHAAHVAAFTTRAKDDRKVDELVGLPLENPTAVAS